MKEFKNMLKNKLYKKMKVIVIFLIMYMFTITFNILLTPVYAEDIITGTAYVLPVEPELIKAQLYRGYLQDRQHIGIYMPAGSSFEIRSKDSKGFKIDILNNDSETEKNGNNGYSIGSDWVTVEATTDSIPFIRTNYGNYNSHSYEIKNKINVQDITVFLKGENESNFFNSWNANSQKFAVIEGHNVKFLVPREDKDKLIGNTEYGFSSLSDMLNWYDNVINDYNRYVGLSDNPTNLYDKNYRNIFFIKPNIHGCGGSCYYPNNYITENGTSLRGFLKKSWGALHELGHGFQHGYTYSDSSLKINEVVNNFFAYYEEQKYLKSGDGGFMWNEHSQEELMNVIRSVDNYNDLVTTVNGEIQYRYYERLFAFTNLFDKIGMEKAMSYTSSQYRKIKNDDGDIKNADLFGKYFSEATGYNVLPYLNYVKIFPSNSIEKEVCEKKLPIVYPVSYVFSKNNAISIANSLNLRGIYSVIENEDINKFALSNNLKRNIRFNIKTDDNRKLKNKMLYIKTDNNKVITSQKIEGNEVLVTDVPLGIYYVDISKGSVANLNYLLVNDVSSLLSSNIEYKSDVIEEEISNDNNEELNVDIKYNYDPNNYNDFGDIVKVPDTKGSLNIFNMILGISFIFVSFLSILIITKTIRKRKYKMYQILI